jgi:hypothetical protein
VARTRDLVRTKDDKGGSHTNSGIPSKAVYETAIRTTSASAGRIWIDSLSELSPKAKFAELASATRRTAGQLFGVGTVEERERCRIVAIGLSFAFWKSTADRCFGFRISLLRHLSGAIRVAPTPVALPRRVRRAPRAGDRPVTPSARHSMRGATRVPMLRRARSPRLGRITQARPNQIRWLV